MNISADVIIIIFLFFILLSFLFLNKIQNLENNWRITFTEFSLELSRCNK